MFRCLALLLLFACLSGAVAQRCQQELQRGFTSAQLAQPATGRDAALLLSRAVELVEPVLPPLAQTSALPLPPSDPAYGAVKFLARRRLLPDSWQADELTPATWAEMLGRVAAWYKLEPPQMSGDTVGALVSSLEDLLEHIGANLRPVALVATDNQNPDKIVFWAIIRNDTVYPRLIVVHPPADHLIGNGGFKGVLAQLSNCALVLTHYVTTSADNALSLYLANNKSRMVIVRADPPAAQELQKVPAGQEPAYFTFQAPAVSADARYAAVFVGPSTGLLTILRLIPHLRTNMSPRQILEAMRTP
jgi:hypothetical protein